MSKSISASLLTDIQKNVAALAVIVRIVRDDGASYAMTNHDTALTVDGLLYTNVTPFTLSAVQTTSELAVDTCTMELALDADFFKGTDISANAFRNGDIEIGLVDWQNPSHGKMILRKGWFNSVDTEKPQTAKFEIGGLLKVLDFSVGRIYQPSCDADLGDRRCRVAVDLSQAYSPLNKYESGDWVYAFDRAAMTAISSIVNPSFETDGVRSEAQAITGWTKSASASWRVSDTSGLNGLTAIAGTYWLEGGQDADPEAKTQYIYQDVDLVSGGVSATAIDEGKIVLCFFVKVIQSAYLLDKPRIIVEERDATGVILRAHDTNWFALDTFAVWRERAVNFHAQPGTRSVRIYLYSKRTEGDVVNTGFDGVEAYFYNHSLSTPYNDYVHKVGRIADLSNVQFLYGPPNPSFEGNLGAVANSNSNTVPAMGGGITKWIKTTGSWWKVDTTLGGISAPDATYMLIAGDDSSGVQQTYEIYSSNAISTSGQPPASLFTSGKVAGRLTGSYIFAGSTGEVKVIFECYDDTNTLITSTVLQDFYNPGVGAATVAFSFNLTFATGTASYKIRLLARTPVGSSTGNVGFDNIRLYVIAAERPAPSDPLTGEATGPTFNYTTGSYTVDGRLIWRAYATFLQYDVVATVTDRKRFTGTTIAGAAGAYETGLIKWLSGNNAGRYNIIRTWDSATKGIKLYFPCVSDIQVGDRFEYVRPCHKRFVEDCVGLFNNAINFQGFPYLPGKLN